MSIKVRKYTMYRLIFVLLFTTLVNQVFAQNLVNGQKRWSANQKLNIADFKIKINDHNTDGVYSQFMISHAFGGFDFMKRNLNQKVENLFLGNASWIDTTRVSEIQQQIDFQQMQFDLAEIQARKFRKRALLNSKKMAKGFQIISEINNEIMAEFAELRLKLIEETEAGQNKQKLEEWKLKISTELEALKEFSYDNKKKIKLNK